VWLLLLIKLLLSLSVSLCLRFISMHLCGVEEPLSPLERAAGRGCGREGHSLRVPSRARVTAAAAVSITLILGKCCLILVAIVVQVVTIGVRVLEVRRGELIVLLPLLLLEVRVRETFLLL
jgi:hypothetical protein